jgi:Lipase (class 3)
VPQDMFTSLTGASRPHHMVDGAGVVLGFSHFGMLAAARWIRGQTAPALKKALEDNPGYALKIIGHSLGGGTAAMLTMMYASANPATLFANLARPAGRRAQLSLRQRKNPGFAG